MERYNCIGIFILLGMLVTASARVGRFYGTSRVGRVNGSWRAAEIVHFANALPKATPTPECVDTIECGDKPFVAKCVTCRQEYFKCNGAGSTPIEQQCSSGMVFNPNPLWPRCILPTNCPFNPPFTVPTTKAPSTTPAASTTAAGGSTASAATTASGDTTVSTASSGGASTSAAASTTPAASTSAAVTTTPAATTSAAVTTTPVASTSAAVTTTPAATTPAATTTTPVPTTTTAAPTPTPECVDSLTCTAKGYFPRCVTCKPDYFLCQSGGQQGQLKQCSTGMVFNTDPNFPRCVLESNCPYHPW